MNKTHKMIVIMHFSTWGPEESRVSYSRCGQLGLRPSIYQYKYTWRDFSENSVLLFACKPLNLEMPKFMLEILQAIKNDLKKSMEGIAAIACASSSWGGKIQLALEFGWVTIGRIQRKLCRSCKMTGEMKRFERIRTAWIRL